VVDVLIVMSGLATASPAVDHHRSGRGRAWVKPSQAIATRAYPRARDACPVIRVTFGRTQHDALAQWTEGTCEVRFHARQSRAGRLFSAAYLCTAMVHEYGHIARHGHGGTGVMSPYLLKPYRPCARRFPSRSRNPWWATDGGARVAARR
jgi:hypothetical protein